MTARHVLVESEGDIVTITLDRPEKRNALALDVMLELTETFEHVGESDALGVVLAANGPVFSAGHNFGDMAGASIDDARHLFAVCTTLMDTVQSIPQPVVARVHALATAAGCQLVATCDLAVAAIDACTFAAWSENAETMMPAAPSRRRSRIARCAARSRVVQSPHSVGASGPTSRNRSQSA